MATRASKPQTPRNLSESDRLLLLVTGPGGAQGGATISFISGDFFVSGDLTAPRPRGFPSEHPSEVDAVIRLRLHPISSSSQANLLHVCPKVFRQPPSPYDAFQT